jgi:hypothetical protein
MNMQQLLLAPLYVCSQVTLGNVCCVAELRLSPTFSAHHSIHVIDHSIISLSLVSYSVMNM